MRNTLLVGALAGCLAAPASAALVQVDVVGSVDFGNLNFGSWQNVTPGDSAVMTFQVDSNVFQNGTFPTRGYNIIESSFSLALDGIAVGMPNPFPVGETPYFILRDNDPAVDGFFLGSHPDVGFPNGVPIDEPAIIDPTFRAIFLATYGGSTLSSLNILDAVGTYDFTGIQVFNWGLEDAGIQPMGFIFDYFTISVVPAPMTVAGFAPLALIATRRRRG